MASIEQLNDIYQATFGRNVDPAGIAAYSGMDVRDIWDIVENSPEKQRLETTKMVQEAAAKGEAWYAGGGNTGMEFSASSGGDIVFLKAGQNVADEYQDITEQLGGWVPKGMRAYVDQGTSTGFFGFLDQTFGTDFFSDTVQNIIPNELKLALTPSPTIAAAVGGKQWANDVADVYGDFLGINRDEFYQYGSLFEDIGIAAASIVNPFFTPALSAVKGITTKLTYDNLDWSDVAENTAWGFAAAAGGSIGGGLIRTAQAKAQGADWSDTAVFAGAAIAGGGTLTPEQQAVLAGAVSGLTGGNFEQIAAAAGGSYAGSHVGANAPAAWGQLAKSGTQAAITLMAQDEDSEDFQKTAQVLNALVSGATTKGAITEPKFELKSLQPSMKQFEGLSDSGAWVNRALYNPDVAFDSNWFNLKPDYAYGLDTKGNRKLWAVTKRAQKETEYERMLKSKAQVLPAATFGVGV